MPSRTTPSIDPPETVVVTGANGFIGQHCVAALLQKGYRVIGTVRTEDKAASVAQVHGNHPGLETAVVADITSADAFVAALGGRSPAAVLHLAAPFTYATDDYERDLMIPAVRGSTAILEAASRMPSVRRVVHTNSFACVYDAAAGPAPGRTYSSADWSPLTYEDGARAADAPTAYRASKTAAERAAWDFVRDRAPSFDLVSLCPAMVFGAFLPAAAPASARDLNTSNGLVRAVVTAGRDGPVPPTKGPVWVDVRDAADAHVRSLTAPGAAGRRFLLAAGVYCNQEIADVANAVAADVAPKMQGRIPLGEPGRREAHLHYAVDASDAEDVLGMRWRDLGDCLRGLLPQLYQMDEGTAGRL